MSKHRIYCEDVSEDAGEFELRCEKDGEIVETKIEHCFEDVLIDVYEFFKECCENYDIDTRFDSIEIDINYQYR